MHCAMILFLIMAGLELDPRINTAIYFSEPMKLLMMSSPASQARTISVTFDFRAYPNSSTPTAGKMSEGSYGIAVTPSAIGL